MFAAPALTTLQRGWIAPGRIAPGRIIKGAVALLAAVSAIVAAGAALAQEGVVPPSSPVPIASPDGDRPNVFAPHDWQIWHQAPGSDLMANIEWFSAYTLWGMAVPVSIFVLFLIAWTVFRYRASAHPVPDKVTHNTLVEVIWTVVPVIILIAVAVPSFQLLSEYERPAEKPTMTIKTVGYQWYWGYEYQDGEEGNELAFEQRLIGRNDGSTEQIQRANLELEKIGKNDTYIYPNNLRVDNEMVVPVGATVRLLVTAADVIHDWAIPAIGAKMDAIPGRLNEFTFTPKREGIYYGQCSELCGRDHAFMPIAMRVVPVELYNEWRRLAQTDIAAASRYISQAQRTLAATRAEQRRLAERDNQKLAATAVAEPVN